MTQDPKLAAIIARRLAQLRKDHGLSQQAVGELLDTSQATVSRWEDERSLSTPSALELAAISRHFGVTADWLVAAAEHRTRLPAGEAIMDQALLSAFGSAKDTETLEELLQRDLSFGTIWVQIPEGAEVMSLREAHRRVKEVDRHVRNLHAGLWERWAKLVLG